MTLNTSGPISLAGGTSGQSVALELGQSSTGTISLNDSSVRNLAGIGSGSISLSSLYGKAAWGLYISPGSQSASGKQTSHAFSVTCGVTTGTPSAYTWSIIAGSGSITGGQGTSSATATITGVTSTTSSITIQVAITNNGSTKTTTATATYTNTL